MKRLLIILLCLLLAAPAACGERLPDEQLITYYDQAFFVGDSLCEMLRYYVNGVVRREHPDYFRDVKFFTAHGYKLETAALRRPSYTETNLMYKGGAITVCGLAEKLQPEKMFILVGMNDRIGDHIDQGVAWIDTIIAMVQEVSPDTTLHFFSLTPIAAQVEKKALGRQEKWDAYNAALKEKCADAGVHFIDIATGLKGEDGLLAPALASEDGYHVNNDGNAIWVQTLLDFAQSQYELGLWAPADQ